MKKTISAIINIVLLSFFVIPAIPANSQWVQISSGIGNDKIVNAFVSSGTSIFAGTSSTGVFITTNNGTNWTQTSLNNKTVNALAVNGGKIFAGTDNGVYTSIDGGFSWSPSGLGSYPVYAFLIVGNIIFAGTNYGVHRSIDNGANWGETSLDGGVITSFALMGTTAFAGKLNAPACSVYLCPVSDTIWSETALQDKKVHSLAVLGTNILAGSDYGVFRSSITGTYWMQIGLSTQAVQALISYSTNIIAGTSAFPTGPAGVFVTTNNGTNWVNKSQGLQLYTITPDVNTLLIANNYIFAGTNLLGSVFRRPLSEIIGIQLIGTEVPTAFSLQQNYPNPFNPTTKIRFDVPANSVGEAYMRQVQMQIYDMLGREVAVLVNEKLSPGTYEVDWNAGGYPSGVYFYSLSTSKFSKTKKMVLLK